MIFIGSYNMYVLFYFIYIDYYINLINVNKLCDFVNIIDREF